MRTMPDLPKDRAIHGFGEQARNALVRLLDQLLRVDPSGLVDFAVALMATVILFHWDASPDPGTSCLP